MVRVAIPICNLWKRSLPTPASPCRELLSASKAKASGRTRRGHFCGTHSRLLKSRGQDATSPTRGCRTKSICSACARGEPKQAKPGAEDVNSIMKGEFTIGDGEITFRHLNYELPGAQVNLSGVYSMDGQQFEFSARVMTKATLRKMVASSWKSWLLTRVSPFFKKDGVGAQIPFKISRTRSEPKFGLDVFHGCSDKNKLETSGEK